jgi:putative transcriptional regulator
LPGENSTGWAKHGKIGAASPNKILKSFPGRQKSDVPAQFSIEAGRYDPSLPLGFKIARVSAQGIETIFDDEQT